MHTVNTNLSLDVVDRDFFLLSKKVDFIEGLSIIDLLFNNGKKSSSIIKALNNFTL